MPSLRTSCEAAAPRSDPSLGVATGALGPTGAPPLWSGGRRPGFLGLFLSGDPPPCLEAGWVGSPSEEVHRGRTAGGMCVRLRGVDVL